MPPRTTAVIALLLLAAGCAGAPQPRPAHAPDLDEAEAAVQRARSGATAEFAALEMRLAEDKLARARTSAAEGTPEALDRASRLAEQAVLDARLAALKSELAQLHRLRRQLRQSLDLLSAAPGASGP